MSHFQHERIIPNDTQRDMPHKPDSKRGRAKDEGPDFLLRPVPFKFTAQPRFTAVLVGVKAKKNFEVNSKISEKYFAQAAGSLEPSS